VDLLFAIAHYRDRAVRDCYLPRKALAVIHDVSPCVPEFVAADEEE